VGEERGLGEFGRSRVYGVVGAAVWCVEADVREIEDCELYAGRARVESGKFFVFFGGGCLGAVVCSMQARACMGEREGDKGESKSESESESESEGESESESESESERESKKERERERAREKAKQEREREREGEGEGGGE